jgi:hypothetical protein
MDRMRKAAAIGLLLVLQIAPAPAGVPARERIVLRVRPAFAQAPATLWIEVMVEADERNRSLVIAVDSGEYYRSTAIALEGAQAPRFHSVQYASVPAGVYAVRAELFTVKGEAGGEAQVAVKVLP